ncbi:MAG TPA: hypothetical protein VJW94_16875 [Candidatus Acidoferrum sp.]|nr:hypothetical protein [Candidatus Acidoferrum sp.]
MRALAKSILAITAGVLLLSLATPSQAQTSQDPMVMARRMARHFPEKPPVQFQILQTAEHEPRVVVTNLHQYALTAFIARTDPTAANSITNTMVFDALARMGLLAPIPRGLSFVTGVPHVVGEPFPDPVLAAAVWEDGSTYGPDDLLARISGSRSALANSYDRAIAMLQTGLDKNWTAAEYSAAAQQLKLARDPAQATIPEASMADFIPIRTISVNMDHATQENRPAKLTAKIARNLLTRFTQDRDALRAALNGSLAARVQE